ITGVASTSSSVETLTSSRRLNASSVSSDGVVVKVRNGMPSSSSSSMRATRLEKKFMATRARMPSSSHIRKICFISSSFLRAAAGADDEDRPVVEALGADVARDHAQRDFFQQQENRGEDAEEDEPGARKLPQRQ